jgi:hypothetical protein
MRLTLKAAGFTGWTTIEDRMTTAMAAVEDKPWRRAEDRNHVAH